MHFQLVSLLTLAFAALTIAAPLPLADAKANAGTTVDSWYLLLLTEM